MWSPRTAVQRFSQTNVQLWLALYRHTPAFRTHRLLISPPDRSHQPRRVSLGASEMGGRDTQITVYVTDERKAELKQRADEEDTSMSGIINDMIDRQLQQDAQDAIASEARAEERIQELISVGTEQMVETAKEIRDMNAKFGAYTIANFELMKQDRSAHVRKDALETGARRIRQDPR